MLAALSVRSYTKAMQQHSHNFYQLVLPLTGISPFRWRNSMAMWEWGRAFALGLTCYISLMQNKQQDLWWQI